MAGQSLVLTIHRSAHEIGGNCIEIRTGDQRLVLDVGRPLDAPSDAKGLIPSTLDLTRPATILISHPHQDHYGLLDEAPPHWPVCCGEPTRRLMTLTAGLTGRVLPQTFNPWPTGSRIEIGPFTVTPMLTDHSAFDATCCSSKRKGKQFYTQATSDGMAARLRWSID